MENVPSNSVMPYQFEGHNFSIVQVDGEPWFFAPEVARELGYDHTPHLTRMMDDDEKGVHTVDTLGGPQEISIISEPGLYRAIVQRRANKKHDASLIARLGRFQRWVFHDILPSIRKTGSYSASDPAERASITAEDLLANPKQLLAITQGYALKIEDMKRELVVLKQDSEVLDRIGVADNMFGVRVTAKVLNMAERKFTDWIQQIRWAYRQNGTRHLLAFADKQRAGYCKNAFETYTKPDGTEGVRETLRFMPAGIIRLARLLNITLTEGDIRAILVEAA